MNRLIYVYILLLFFILLPQSILAQDSKSAHRDSTQQRASKGIKEKFPSTRILNFEYDQSQNRNFHSKLFDKDYVNGKIKNQSNFRASANIPLYHKGTFTIMASGRYTYSKLEFTNLNNRYDSQVFEKEGISEFHYFSTAISATYFSELLNKPVIYNSSLFLDGNEKGFHRVKGFAGLAFILKRTKRTTITLGAVVIVDVTSQIPIFPTFSYTHKFKNSKWELDFILPQRLLFRRFVGKDGRLSVGSTFGVTGFYANVDSPGIPELNEYSQLEIKTGVIYEHRINHFLIGKIQGGLQNFISNRLTEKGKNTKDYFYSNNQDATGYFQVGFSIDPFAKK